MKTGLLFMLMSLAQLLAFGQSASLKQPDAKGKKHGQFKMYLTDKWKVTKDSTKAIFYYYTHYYHGEDVYPMWPQKKNGVLKTPAGQIVEKGKPQLLDGRYEWYNREGDFTSGFTFHEGDFVSHRCYYRNGALRDSCDYTQQLYWNEPHSYSVDYYDKKGRLRPFYSPMPFGLYKSMPKLQEEQYNNPKVGDYYIVYDDKNSWPGDYNLAKVIDVTPDSLKLSISTATYKNMQGFYTNVNEGITEAKPAYFKNDSTISVSRIHDPRLKWKWIKEVIRK